MTSVRSLARLLLVALVFTGLADAAFAKSSDWSCKVKDGEVVIKKKDETTGVAKTRLPKVEVTKFLTVNDAMCLAVKSSDGRGNAVCELFDAHTARLLNWVNAAAMDSPGQPEWVKELRK